MGSLTERNLANARKGLFDRDEGWCNTVIADDEEIDSLEIQIDREGVDLMLRFHPVASDMRNVIATIKLNANLERVADQAVNIARRGRKLIARDPVASIEGVAPIFNAAESILRDAMKAYADNDIDLARSLKARDRQIDAAARQYSDNLTDLMARDTANIPSYMDLIFVSRFLERIGDQATNIAEDIVYAVMAEDIRHTDRVAN
jgi:phosphate transport system protein